LNEIDIEHHAKSAVPFRRLADLNRHTAPRLPATPTRRRDLPPGKRLGKNENGGPEGPPIYREGCSIRSTFKRR